MAAPAFNVVPLPRVDKQIRDLAKRAAALGIADPLMVALKVLDKKLQATPGRFGDPVHKTKKKGGVVHVAVIEPISVRFAIYESEKAVLLLDVLPLSRFFPE